MDQNDVIQYIQHQFGIQPNYQLARQWNACVFSSPLSGRWFALLIQPQGSVRSCYLELNCGDKLIVQYQKRLSLQAPKRMKKSGWARITIGEQTPQEDLQRLLEEVFKKSLHQEDDSPRSEQLIYVPPVKQRTVYRDQPLNFSKRTVPFEKKTRIPKEILKMNGLYDYTLPPLIGRAKNFYVQGQAMADYRDDYQYYGKFERYFPVYHEMTTAQLRGYFTWRARVRDGKFTKAPTSFAYVYLYELLNKIGVSSPVDGYQKMIAFRDGYAEFMDCKMQEYLKQWLQDYVVYYQLGDEYVKETFGEELNQNELYNDLTTPDEVAAEQIMTDLEKLSSYSLSHCPLMERDPELLAAIVKACWQRLGTIKDEDFYKNYLGWQGKMTRQPFANAVFYDQKSKQTFDYSLDEFLTYHYQFGKWTYPYYVSAKRQKQKIGSLLHEIDRLVRQTFHLGRQLKPRPLREKLLVEIQPAINAAQQQITEARRPKIEINLGHLDKIREDASETRESLLTDEERAAEQEEEISQVEKEPKKTSEETLEEDQVNNDLGLSKDELYLLRCLLDHASWQVYFKEHHLMVSVIVDEVNEKLFDEIGDTVIEFDDQDQPQLIDDYREDIEELIG